MKIEGYTQDGSWKFSKSKPLAERVKDFSSGLAEKVNNVYQHMSRNSVQQNINDLSYKIRQGYDSTIKPLKQAGIFSLDSVISRQSLIDNYQALKEKIMDLGITKEKFNYLMEAGYNALKRAGGNIKKAISYIARYNRRIFTENRGSIYIGGRDGGAGAALSGTYKGNSTGGKNKKGFGFTSMELLVTITTISILVAMLSFSLIRTKELARRVVCASNLRQIGIALHVYAHDHNDWLPRDYPGAVGAECYDDLEKPGVKMFLGVLWPNYLSDPRIFYCPSEADPNRKYPYAWNNLDASNAINGTYDYWGRDGNRNSLRKDPGRAIAGDINISWGDEWLKQSLVSRYGYTHKGEGQNVLHLDGDVWWYPRSLTYNNDWYCGPPDSGDGPFKCIDH